MKKQRSVITCTGGGGPLLTGTIGESKAYNCDSEQRERAEAPSESVKQNCHPELVSASVQRCVLPVTLDRSRNKFGMTLAEPVLQLNPIKNAAFTMAEILLSLTIIGVVAAITLPSLTGNINERTWNTQRKALYARFSQAIALMPALNGYGTLRESTDSAGSTSIEDTAAETFITSGLAKVLKINNICDSEHIEDCGITSRYTTLYGQQKNTPATMGELNSAMLNVSYSLTSSIIAWGGDGSYSQLNTKAAAFETQNGESILAFYNPNCVPDMQENGYYWVQPKICANFVYDLNGNKGPNTVGKDIGFITVLYPSDSVVVAPVPDRAILTGVTAEEAPTACTAIGEDYRIPTADELASIFINKTAILESPTLTIFSSTKRVMISGNLTNWVMSGNGEYRHVGDASAAWSVLCVKR